MTEQPPAPYRRSGDPDLIRRSGPEWREMQRKVDQIASDTRMLVDPQYGAIPQMRREIADFRQEIEEQIANAGARRTARISTETIKLIAGILATVAALVIVYLLTNGHA